MEIRFCVKGAPLPLKRHRICRGRVYDPSKADKQTWIEKIAEFIPETPLNKELEIDIQFIMPRPKSHFGTGKNNTKVKESANKHHVSKPDLDNLIKFVLDAMNTYFYADDSQIVKITSTKVYSNLHTLNDVGTYITLKQYT